MGKVGPYTTQIGPIQYRSYHSPHDGYGVQVHIYILYLYGVESYYNNCVCVCSTWSLALT